MATIKRVEEIEAWQEGRRLVRKIYGITREGSFSKDYAQKDQLRRASISIVANIAEGFERDSNTEFVHFLSVAKGSAGALHSLLNVALEEVYVDVQLFEDLHEQSCRTIPKIAGLLYYFC
jgi:four helix bundle protein